MKKKVTFHGVDYIIVPVAMWDEARRVLGTRWFTSDEEGESYNDDEVIEISEAMDAYSQESEIV